MEDHVSLAKLVRQNIRYKAGERARLVENRFLSLLEFLFRNFVQPPDDAFEKNCGAKRSTEHTCKTIKCYF